MKFIAMIFASSVFLSESLYGSEFDETGIFFSIEQPGANDSIPNIEKNANDHWTRSMLTKDRKSLRSIDSLTQRLDTTSIKDVSNENGLIMDKHLGSDSIASIRGRLSGRRRTLSDVFNDKKLFSDSIAFIVIGYKTLEQGGDKLEFDSTHLKSARMFEKDGSQPKDVADLDKIEKFPHSNRLATAEEIKIDSLKKVKFIDAADKEIVRHFPDDDKLAIFFSGANLDSLNREDLTSTISGQLLQDHSSYKTIKQISEIKSDSVTGRKITEVVGNKVVGEVQGEVKINDLKLKVDVDSLSQEQIASAAEKEIVERIPDDGELKKLASGETLDKAIIKEAQNVSNMDSYRAEIKARAKTVSAQYAADYEKAINESIAHVNKFHRKSGTIFQKAKNLPQRRDALKKLSLREKLVPSFTSQVFKTPTWLMDINPAIAYRLTSYWSIGTGWNERIELTKKEYYNKAEQTRTYGLRSFTEVVVFRGISARIEAEYSHTMLNEFNKSIDERSTGWVWNYNIGVKKDFSLFPRVTGNAQLMYNVYNTIDTFQYPNMVNIRAGFEYHFKKNKSKK